MQKEDNLTVLVGSGIVNLITAFILVNKGLKVQIYDRMPAPSLENNWKECGATFGGYDARMCSYTEADNYNEKGSEIYSQMTNVFNNHITDNGWSVVKRTTSRETKWISAFRATGHEDAEKFSSVIYDQNIRSGRLWENLMTEFPQIFEKVNLRNGIIRMYSDARDFDCALKIHKSINSYVSTINGSLKGFPPAYFENLMKKKQLGGAMVVKGFTLQIHRLCDNLIRYLKDSGVDFHWERNFLGLKKNKSGRVTGIQMDTEIITAKNFILSLGAYCGKVYDNTKSKNVIHGVSGIWLAIPNINHIEYSLKIHKSGKLAEDTNVTVVRNGPDSQLIFGSGYAYMGSLTKNKTTTSDLKPIYNSLIRTAEIYFPEETEMAKKNGLLFENWRYCVRPFTPNGLGVFEIIKNADKGLTIITGGNNTGGFTQAPFIAESVAGQL